MPGDSKPATVLCCGGRVPSPPCPPEGADVCYHRTWWIVAAIPYTILVIIGALELARYLNSVGDSGGPQP